MKKRGNLFIVSGPSGAGKGTITRKVLAKREDVKLSVSVTTREPRNGELEGINYYFKEKETFKKMIENNAFLEYASVYNNFYGTPRDKVLESIENGESVILEIDIQGALQVKQKYDDAIFVFILPPSMAELKKRIIGRGSETDESLKTRMLSAFEEISYMEKYDYFIINDNLERAVDEMDSIITAESCRVQQDIEDIINHYKEEL